MATTISKSAGEASIRPSSRTKANLAPAVLVEEALAQGNAKLTSVGALAADTRPRTGRSVKDRFIVRDATTSGKVDWGTMNQPIEPERANELHHRVEAYLKQKDTYTVDCYAGADSTCGIRVRVIAEYAWHALFAHQLLRRANPAEDSNFEPDLVIQGAPGYKCDPARDGVHSEVAIVLDITRRKITIAGTAYAGEIKKSVFSYLNFLYPGQDVLPMHCGANLGRDGDVALFFGLSGTGKTTLSADPDRFLIGDDEHGWGKNGVFNFEGGCYAKCIGLEHEKEPQIYEAIRFGSVLENVAIGKSSRIADYYDGSVTQNTRAAYPLEFIHDASPNSMGGHAKTILLLTADAFGVLPPIAKLSVEQALYYFISGYTAKLAGTEAGLSDQPEATFSTCFAAPFLPLPAETYAAMLRQRIEQHHPRCFLVNTGWTGGPPGTGRRFPLPETRTMVRAILSGALDDAPVETDKIFGLNVPVHVPGVSDGLLKPRSAWANPTAYDAAARNLAIKFHENFRRFRNAPETVRAAGPIDGR
ncbi:MAG: phosphoenolpyruvate carboxykinase (ATP) [Terriglobia bacterium]